MKRTGMKRRLLVIAPCLLAGVMLSVLTAWAISVWVPCLNTRVWDNPVSGPVGRVVGVPADWPMTDHIARRSGFGITEWHFMQRDDPVTLKPPAGYSVLRLYCFGWPCRVLELQVANRRGFGRLPAPSGIPAVKIPNWLRPEWTRPR